MDKILQFFRKQRFKILLVLVLLTSFFLKLHNLNYNSPFNDEAIYVVVGKVGLFEKDWVTLAPFQWMAGVPYFYPTVTAVAYKIGGIAASRAVNVIFFTFTTYIIYKIAYIMRTGDVKGKATSGIIASVVFAGSSLGYYVSRLATYDMPSFFFFALGMYYFVAAERARMLPGRKYILASICFMAGFFFKYVVAIYIPFLLMISYFDPKKTKYRKKAVVIYLVIPVMVSFLLFGAIESGNVLTYVNEQSALEVKSSLDELLAIIQDQINLVFVFWALGTFGYLTNKKHKEWVVITCFSAIIAAAHIFAMRAHTFDKHLLLAVGGMAVTSGIGISLLADKIKKRNKEAYSLVLAAILVIFWGLSYVIGKQHDGSWKNTNTVMSIVQNTARSEDIVLSEIGAVTQLDLYEIADPLQVYTFDWIFYDEQEGEEAISAGVTDGYFDIIILESQDDPKSDISVSMHDLIVSNDEFDRLYSEIYADSNFNVYRRKY